MAHVRSEKAMAIYFSSESRLSLSDCGCKSCMKVKNSSVTLFSNLHCNASYLGTAVFLDGASGLRVGELVGLKWEDVDFERNVIHIKPSIVKQRMRHG